jgi:hypothetical protein
VLADEAMPLSALDAAAIETNMRTLEGALANLRDRLARQSGDEREAAQLELASTEAKLAVETAKLAALRQTAAH